MDMHVLGKLMCVLLCALGCVGNQDGCATFGKVSNFYRDCFIGRVYGKPFNKCSFSASIRECMANKTVKCAEYASVMAEVDNAFYVCDGNNVSSWVQQHLVPLEPEEMCPMNQTARKTCSDNVAQAAKGFPFTNQTLRDGVEAMKGMKRAFFSYFKIAYEANADCTKSAQKRNYMHSIVRFMADVYLFGEYIEETDTVELVQDEPSLQQTSLNIRDLFPGVFS